MKRIGIITYNYPHLKTEQVMLNLHSQGYKMIVYALPFVQRAKIQSLFQHRPNQSIAAHPQDICKALNASFKAIDSDVDIKNDCDVYVLSGAGVLSSKCVENKKILNCHPGIIPLARGLDAFKWSIYHNIPLGNTLHYIDSDIDMGKIITILPTKIFASDSLDSLARRHYESEISLLSNFMHYIKNPNNPFENAKILESTRRMPKDKEAQMIANFKAYKKAFAKI